MDLGADVKALVLSNQEAKFPAYEDASRVLFVRKCIRDIYDGIKAFRERKFDGHVAVVGQPGIGKSYAMFYFARRFLQEDDVDAVVLENAEQNLYYIFYGSAYDQKDLPEKLREKTRIFINEANTEMVFMLLESRRVVYLADMTEDKKPTIVIRDTGFSLFSSSPGPYKAHLLRLQQKMLLELFSPPPWSKKETGVVYEWNEKIKGDGFDGLSLAIDNWKNGGEHRTFDLYFYTFGGTLRPMHDAVQEFRKMQAGSELLESAQPKDIVDIIKKGASSANSDMTHSLFSELGGAPDANYAIGYIPGKRAFRSKFAEFWFKKYIAPRILTKAYTADVLQVLCDANEEANGSVRGSKFEDLFHKLLPMGKWKIEAVPTEKTTPNPHEWVAAFLGWFKTSTNQVDMDTLDLKNIPVKQRTADETVDEADLNAWDTKKGTVNTEANRKDVGHLINTWKTCTRFYWVPLGSEFPGLDSMLRDGSKVYFVQVKTGKIARKTYSWIDDAFKYTKLLLEKLGNTKGIEVTILLGTEPSNPPVLGKRKRDAIEKSNYPKSWKLRYVADSVSSAIKGDQKLDLNLYDELATEFSNFLVADEGPVQAPTPAAQKESG